MNSDKEKGFILRKEMNCKNLNSNIDRSKMRQLKETKGIKISKIITKIS